jgi:1-acyl-sn-glycerol-3-phosphate acyltransferase
MTQALISYEMKAGGAVTYSPLRADPSCGFGPYEVHPQMVQVVRDCCARLEHNGEWLCLFPEGETFQYLAFPPARGGKLTAERLAASYNAGQSTRVVHLDGSESTSTHTAASVQAELDAKAIAPKAN